MSKSEHAHMYILQEKQTITGLQQALRINYAKPRSKLADLNCPWWARKKKKKIAVEKYKLAVYRMCLKKVSNTDKKKM